MKIAYIGEHHPTEGTYYRQRITITQEEYNYINQKLIENYTRTQKAIKNSHIITNDQMETLCYGKPLDETDRIGNKIYIKLNQLYTIWSLFPDNKRFTDNNTILIVK